MHWIEDTELLALQIGENKSFVLMPSSYKNKRQKRCVAQPRCHAGVCSKSCPYRGQPFKADVVHLVNGKDAVCLLREMEKGVWTSCLIMYLNGKCGLDAISIEQNAFPFMRGHSARVMQDCPLRMEHMLSGWSNGRKDT